MQRVGDEPVSLLESDPERERHPIANELQQLHVVVSELPGGQRAHVQDAEDVPIRNEGNSEQGLDALLAQDRIQHICVIHVADRAGASCGHDPAGESTSHRDPHPLVDLLLEPFGGSRYELVSRRIQEEHGRGVGTKRFTDAGQKLVQQLIDGEVRKGGVTHALEPPQPFDRSDLPRMPRELGEAHAKSVPTREPPRTRVMGC